MTSTIKLHHTIAQSTVNGPGKRFAIWVQGCPLNCEGCFNQKTHDMSTGTEVNITTLADEINQTQDIRGITLSGGEPLFQAEAVSELLKKIKKHLDVLLFSGYTLNEIMNDSQKKQVLHLVDAGLLGRYNKKLPHPFYGKKLVINGNRIKKEELTPWLATEIIINEDNVEVTGLYKQTTKGTENEVC